MADPSGHERGAESVGGLEDLSESSSIVDYSQSLADMFASNKQFLREEIYTLPFSEENDETLRTAFDWNFEEYSGGELAGNRSTRVINEDGSSEIEIKEESEARSETQVQEERIRGRKTKGATPEPVFPEKYRAYVDRAGGNDIKLIFKKILSKSDVDHRSARLSMPHSKIPQNFLTETKSVQDGGEMDVNLVDPQLKERSMRMGTWKSMGPCYVLKKTWNDVVRENDLKMNDEVQIWSFRVGGELRLALVAVGKPVGDGGESSHQIHE